jgi:DNA-binding NtrC family response regulator
MEHPDKAPITVLLIDDDGEMRTLLRDFLAREGHRVIEESSGEGAMATTELERVDAVILDKEMPGIGGFDFLSFFRRRWPHIPVIVITAFGGPRVAEEAFRRGATRYLEKPFRVTDLLAAIRTVTRAGERLSSLEGGP